jgi:hypothetical protein
MTRPGVARWRTAIVPAIGALLLVGVAASVAARPSSSPSLPRIAPERLIASALRALAQDRPVSGHLTAHIDLGLPSLPADGPGASASEGAGFLASLTGTHRLRLWSSADGFRLADLLQSSERAIFVSRTAAWAWDFDSFTAYRLGPFPKGASGSEGKPSHGGWEVMDPLDLARRALDGITPTTRVSVTGTARIAGRDAYVLALEPRTTDTLVGRIEISLDAGRWIPLRVAVIPRGRGATAISVAFTSVSFAPIDPSVYRFTPPEGAVVRDVTRGFGESGIGKGQGIEGSSRDAYGQDPERGDATVRIFGHDWTTIVALRTPSRAMLEGEGGLDLTSLLPLSGPLLSVRLVDRGDHGWLVYGLVPQSALIDAARELP